MGHTPYGYRIENGQAMPDEVAATHVRSFFRKYLSGLSLTTAAKEAGFTIFHGGAVRMLKNKHYLGDDFYPQLIDKKTFAAAAAEQQRRAAKLGRIHDNNNESTTTVPPSKFSMKAIVEHHEEPFMQAEYIYSLIESEVNSDGR